MLRSIAGKGNRIVISISFVDIRLYAMFEADIIMINFLDDSEEKADMLDNRERIKDWYLPSKAERTKFADGPKTQTLR